MKRLLQRVALPLIALAYAAFAAGLFAGFGGIAWIAVVMGSCGGLHGLMRGDWRNIALALILGSGALIALTSAQPQRDRRNSGSSSDSTFLKSMRKRANHSI